jgi:hypothetical protein
MSFATEEPKTRKQKFLEAGARVMQNLDPVKSFNQHLASIYFVSGDPSNQILLHSYLNSFNEEFGHALLYDGEKADSRLVGIQYIISERVFVKMPEEEKKMWHSFYFMIKHGLILAPSMPAMAEKPLMLRLSSCYGKTFLFWNTSQHLLPFGVPQLLMSFTSEEPVNQMLLKHLYTFTERRQDEIVRKRRKIPTIVIHPGSDAWQQGEAYQFRLDRPSTSMSTGGMKSEGFQGGSSFPTGTQQFNPPFQSTDSRSSLGSMNRESTNITSHISTGPSANIPQNVSPIGSAEASMSPQNKLFTINEQIVHPPSLTPSQTPVPSMQPVTLPTIPTPFPPMSAISTPQSAQSYSSPPFQEGAQMHPVSSFGQASTSPSGQSFAPQQQSFSPPLAQDKTDLPPSSTNREVPLTSSFQTKTPSSASSDFTKYTEACLSHPLGLPVASGEQPAGLRNLEQISGESTSHGNHGGSSLHEQVSDISSSTASDGSVRSHSPSTMSSLSPPHLSPSNETTFSPVFSSPQPLSDQALSNKTSTSSTLSPTSPYSQQPTSSTITSSSPSSEISIERKFSDEGPSTSTSLEDSVKRLSDLRFDRQGQ